jgi:hypothetical protein
MGSNKFCLDVDGITIKRPGDGGSVFEIPLMTALTSGRVGVTDLAAARWHERMCRINGSERKADEKVVGTSPVRPLGKIAGWIGVGNGHGSTVMLLLRSADRYWLSIGRRRLVRMDRSKRESGAIL